jgi:glycine/D-amino acid oxidase-like deaminating enzyme
MHPGVTLAAVAGRLVSDELIDDQVSPALAPCRPDRFFKT